MADVSPNPGPGWRRKTEDERRRDLARQARLARIDPTTPLLFGLAGFTVGLVITVRVVIRAGDLGPPAAVLLPAALAAVMGLMCFVAAYVLQGLGWLSRRPRPRMGLCDRCFSLTLDGRLDRCACGGTYEDADGWTLNRCPKCDYDLRESPDRCPECGAAPAAPSA